MKLLSINRFLDIIYNFWRECLIFFGILLFVIIYIFSFNRNLLIMSLLLALYIICLAIFSRFWETFLSLILCVGLAVAQVNVADGKFVKPVLNLDAAPASDDTLVFEVSNFLDPLKPFEVWRYEFQVYDFDEHIQECGRNLQGIIYIDGLDLSGLSIKVDQNKANVSKRKIFEKQFLDEMRIPLEERASGDIVVSLSFGGQTPPKIYLGTEAIGFEMYSDAVWLEYANENCSIIYHAQRQVFTR